MHLYLSLWSLFYLIRLHKGGLSWSTLSVAKWFSCTHPTYDQWGFFSWNLWKFTSNLFKWLTLLKIKTSIHRYLLFRSWSITSSFKYFMHLINRLAPIHMNLIRTIIHKYSTIWLHTTIILVVSFCTMWIQLNSVRLKTTPISILTLCIL